MRLRIILTALTALIAPAAAADPKVDEDGRVRFVTPSKNIGCIYTPGAGTMAYTPPDGKDELSCGRQQPKYVIVFLRGSGKAETYPAEGDQPFFFGDEQVFPYGQKWSLGPFLCVSAETGLTCRRGKNGFSLSKAKTAAY